MVKNRILIIDQDMALAPILKLVSLGDITHPFELARDEDEAFYCLNQFDDIALIISSWSLDKSKQKKIMLHNGGQKNIPHILLSKESKSETIKEIPYFFTNAKNSVVEFNRMNTDFLPVIRHALEDYTKTGEFHVVSYPLLLRFGSLGHEVFHHLKGEDRYIALNQKFDSIDIPKVLTFRSENYHLYMKTKSYKIYLNKVITALLNQSDESCENAPLTSAILLEKYKAFGLKEETFKESQKLLIHYLASLKLHKDILKQLTWMKRVHEYRYLASTLALSFALEIGRVLEIDGDKFSEKMAYAALLKDISLKENFTSLISREDVLYIDIEDREKEEIFKHPQESARMLAHITTIPSDTLKIIEQHHEMPDGSGYPRGLSYTHIHSASALYIISYHAAHQMIKNFQLEDTELIDRVKTYLELYFSIPKFTKYKEALLGLLK